MASQRFPSSNEAAADRVAADIAFAEKLQTPNPPSEK
jgi:hypothetical protein